MKIITIYGLRALGGEIRYVGKTSRSLKARLNEHIRHAKRPKGKDNHRFKWIRSLLQSGERPEIVQLETVAVGEWETAEQRWIDRLKRAGADLVNSDKTGTGKIEGDWGVKGADHYRAKLTEQDVVTLCGQYATGQYTQKALAEMYGISPSNVGLLVRGEAWPHVERSVTKKRGRKVSEADVIAICTKYATGNYTMYDLADVYSISYQMVHQLVTGKRWTDVDRPITHAAQGDIKIKYRLGLRTGQRGERGANSKLTGGQVSEIRRLYAMGEYSQRQIGEKFGVAQQTISVAVRRETWIDVPNKEG